VVTIPIPKDTMVYVDVPVSVLSLNIKSHRVDNDLEGVFSFYDFGVFSIIEAKMNDGRVFFSVIRQ